MSVPFPNIPVPDWLLYEIASSGVIPPAAVGQSMFTVYEAPPASVTEKCPSIVPTLLPITLWPKEILGQRAHNIMKHNSAADLSNLIMAIALSVSFESDSLPKCLFE